MAPLPTASARRPSTETSSTVGRGGGASGVPAQAARRRARRGADKRTACFMPPMITSPHDTCRSGAGTATSNRSFRRSHRKGRGASAAPTGGSRRSVGLAELVDELVGVAAHRGVEYLQRAVVVRVAQHLAGADELEAGGL